MIEDLEHGRIETAWSDAHGGSDTPDSFSRVESHEGMIFERRTRQVDAPAREVYRVFTGIGGDRGWFYGDWMWRIRGMVDRLLGGAGLRRGRRHPDELRVGDALDFWRVEALEPGRLVRLRAEMKLPGRAWLQFRCRRPKTEDPAGADRGLPSQGAGRAALLVRSVPGPRPNLRRTRAGDRQARRGLTSL